MMVNEKLDVRLVPISEEQVKALESLRHALRLLADDFHRDVGAADDEAMAGGLYRLWSTLDVIRTLWLAEGEDPARVDGWRRALEQIRTQAPTDDLRALAENALDGPRRRE